MHGQRKVPRNTAHTHDRGRLSSHPALPSLLATPTPLSRSRKPHRLHTHTHTRPTPIAWTTHNPIYTHARAPTPATLHGPHTNQHTHTHVPVHRTCMTPQGSTCGPCPVAGCRSIPPGTPLRGRRTECQSPGPGTPPAPHPHARDGRTASRAPDTPCTMPWCHTMTKQQGKERCEGVCRVMSQTKSRASGQAATTSIQQS
jgi:hypothetical protein